MVDMLDDYVRGVEKQWVVAFERQTYGGGDRHWLR
jgi:hypothetical protein